MRDFHLTKKKKNTVHRKIVNTHFISVVGLNKY